MFPRRYVRTNDEDSWIQISTLTTKISAGLRFKSQFTIWNINKIYKYYIIYTYIIFERITSQHHNNQTSQQPSNQTTKQPSNQATKQQNSTTSKHHNSKTTLQDDVTTPNCDQSSNFTFLHIQETRKGHVKRASSTNNS